MATSLLGLFWPCGVELQFPTITLTSTEYAEPRKDSKMKKIKYYIFCIRWLWKNKEWSETRQKYKAMNREYEKHLSEVIRRTK